MVVGLMSLAETLNAVWESLFFGSGSWLGLLIIISIVASLLIRFKYIAVLTTPVMILLGVDYLNHTLGWHALIMFFTSIFVFIYSLIKGRG